MIALAVIAIIAGVVLGTWLVGELIRGHSS